MKLLHHIQMHMDWDKTYKPSQQEHEQDDKDVTKLIRRKTNYICYMIEIEFRSMYQRYELIQKIRQQKVKEDTQYEWFLVKIQQVLYVDNARLTEIQKTDKKANDEEEGNGDKDDDEDDDDDDNTDGDNDIRAMKESDVQNQIS